MSLSLMMAFVGDILFGGLDFDKMVSPLHFFTYLCCFFIIYLSSQVLIVVNPIQGNLTYTRPTCVSLKSETVLEPTCTRLLTETESGKHGH